MIELNGSAILSTVTAIAIAVAGWLVRRAIGGVDTKITSVDLKIDGLTKLVGENQVDLAVALTRISTLELDTRDLQKKYDDLSGYLSTQGFKARHSDGSF